VEPGRRYRKHDPDDGNDDGCAATVVRAPIGGTIRRRVARILALPAVVILLLLAVVAAGQVQDYRASRDASRSVVLALAVQDLVHELQNERGVTAAVLGGNSSFRNELGPARKLVDDQRARLSGLVDGDGPYEPEIRSAVQQLDGLPSVRAATDATTAGRAAAFDYYTGRIAALRRIHAGLDRADDEPLRRGAAAMQALGDIGEAIAQERAFLNGVYSAGGFAEGEFVQFAAMRAEKQEAMARFESFASPEQLAARDFVFDTGAARTTDYFEEVALGAFDGRHIVVNPQSWWSGLTTVLDDLRQLQDHVGSQIQVRAHEVQTGSGQRIALLLAVVLVCFAGSVYLVVLASLSITRPLAELAAEADSVAADRLQAAVRQAQTSDEDDPPQPPARVQVPNRATEEIRSVAAALDRMQSVAYSLATEQALQRRRTIESLTNLGHRNQNLIRRQLGFITTLEREEIDPSALANLFELDHLATRMRRNAASLLVLVGASSPRQWASPVAVADVIRAAVSEVEEYRRVGLRRVDDALVTGNAVGAVAHLLSELIENGLTFSPPDSEVEVQGRWVSDGYLIAITDSGIGMGEEDIEVANARLRGEGDFIAAPTRFLGHFVVGQLASETGVRVELRPSPVTGITARITLPESLLVRPMVVEAPPSTVLNEITDSASAPGSGAAAIAASASGPASGSPAGLTSGSLAGSAAGSASGSLSAAARRSPGRPPLPQPTGPDTGSWSLPITAETGGAGASVTALQSPGPEGGGWGPQPPSGQPQPGDRASGRSYQDTDFGTGPYGTGPIPVPPVAAPVTPGAGVRASSVGLMADSRGATGTNGSAGAPAANGDSLHTRNGLRKRVRRDERPQGEIETPPRGFARPEPAAPVDDSPDMVRSRLTAFRAGIERGQQGSDSSAGAAGAPRQTGAEHVVEEPE
jgi:hypothetical protein